MHIYDGMRVRVKYYNIQACVSQFIGPTRILKNQVTRKSFFRRGTKVVFYHMSITTFHEITFRSFERLALMYDLSVLFYPKRTSTDCQGVKHRDEKLLTGVQVAVWCRHGERLHKVPRVERHHVEVSDRVKANK